MDELKLENLNNMETNNDGCSFDITFENEKDISYDSFLSQTTSQIKSFYPGADSDNVNAKIGDLVIYGCVDLVLLKNKMLELDLSSNKLLLIDNTDSLVSCFNVSEQSNNNSTNGKNSEKRKNTKNKKNSQSSNGRHCYIKFYAQHDEEQQQHDKNNSNSTNESIVNSPYILVEYKNSKDSCVSFRWSPSFATTQVQVQSNTQLPIAIAGEVNTEDAESDDSDSDESSSSEDHDWEKEFSNLVTHTRSEFDIEKSEPFRIRIKDTPARGCDMSTIEDGDDLEYTWKWIVDAMNESDKASKNDGVFLSCRVILGDDDELIEMSSSDDNENESEEKSNELVSNTRGISQNGNKLTKVCFWFYFKKQKLKQIILKCFWFLIFGVCDRNV